MRLRSSEKKKRINNRGTIVLDTSQKEYDGDTVIKKIIESKAVLSGGKATKTRNIVQSRCTLRTNTERGKTKWTTSKHYDVW